MNEPPKKRQRFLQWGILLGYLAVLVMLAYPGGSGSRVQTLGGQLKGVVNCKQIILSLKLYARNADSAYPDSQKKEFHSSNQVFRELFKQGIVIDERIFGCPDSIFKPDNLNGNPPGYEMALQPGECHWMLLKMQSDLSHSKMPVVIENSLVSSWPPRWDMKMPAFSWLWHESLTGRGRAWNGGRVIIGRNDGSVAVEKLCPDGTLDWHSKNNLGPDGKSWIDSLSPEQIAKLSYWDIEGK